MIKTYASVALIAFWMLVGGVAHMLVPEKFYPIVPDFFPKLSVVYISGIVEIIIGLMVLFPKTRALGGLAFALLCLGLLPLHLWDLVRDNPAVAPLGAAIIRVFVQFFLIWIGWRLWKRGQATI